MSKLTEEFDRKKHNEARIKSYDKTRQRKTLLLEWMKEYNSHLPGDAVYKFYEIINK